MTRAGRWILCMLLWTWGGSVYFLLEVIYKTIIGHSQQISWTMLLVATLLTAAVERCGFQLPWRVPIWIQALVCAVLVTIVEFIAGIILNVWMGLNIWDYSHLWGNIMGQICPQFFLIWWVLCFMFIPVFDWMWYSIVGGEKPKYYIR